MSYSLIDLSESLQDNRYPITNDFGLLYYLEGDGNGYFISTSFYWSDVTTICSNQTIL